jgi:hypothetical protein
MVMTNQLTHDEVIAWIDEAVKLLRQRIATTTLGDGSVQALDRITIASLLANRDVLERHQINQKDKSAGGSWCSECNFSDPCPTYQDIYNRIREVEK